MILMARRTKIILGSSLVLLAALTLGAGPPEVVGVRVPSDQVSQWFPTGTELRGLAADEFEGLMKAACAGYERQRVIAPPRLLRARHSARWDEARGLLVGRTELVVEPSSSPSGPGELLLSPWTPAIATDAAGPVVLAHQDGPAAVRVGAGSPARVALRWQLRARPTSRGRGFTLGLPTVATAALEVDLPVGTVPEGPPGIRRGPDPGPDPGRATWRFEGPGGAVDLELRDASEDRDPRREARIWVSGPTRIDLRDATANWSMDWTVDAGRGARTLQLELDPGLELIDVTGPAVANYRSETAGAATRVVVRLDGDGAPAMLSVHALTRVPVEGAWVVPAARPLDALWTGGTTSITLDASRVLEECRERSGRRIAAPAGETGDPRVLVFEAREPLSVAEVVFHKPSPDVSADVRGKLFLGAGAPRLESQITWRIHRGRLVGLGVDLPPAWVPDRIQLAGVEEPLDWHPEPLAGGGVRVHVVPPAGLPERGPVLLTVEATATIAGGRGPLALPRVQPVGARVADELWVAWTEPSLTLRPTSARGLAWVDPRLVTGLPGGFGAGSASAAATVPTAINSAEGGLRGILAWRWLAPQAEALVDRQRIETEASGTVDLRATVDRTRVRYDGQIVFQAGEDPVTTLPIGTTGPWADAPTWHFEDEATGLELQQRPIDPNHQAALGLPAAGRAWELLLPHARRGRVAVRAQLQRPWPGQEALPLFILPERFHTRGTIVIEVEQSVRSTVSATGLRALDPSALAPGRMADDDRPADPLAYRRAHAFGYSSAGGALELRTEALDPLPTAAVIREAVLTTTWNPAGSSRQHLVLRVASDRPQRLELVLPAGATLARVLRDGLPLVPTREGQAVAIPLVTPRATRSFSAITVDYLTRNESVTADAVLHSQVPSISLPCLAFCWEIVAPAPWAMTDNSPGLLPMDPPLGALLPASVLRDWGSSWRALGRLFRGSAAEPPQAALLHSLDALVVATRPDEVTLGEWFTRWDSGPAPIVIDRLAMAAAGWGPRSRVVPPQVAAPAAGAAQAALRTLSLRIVPVGGALLITDEAGAQDRAVEDTKASTQRDESVRQAVAWGYDRTDRYQSVPRWRGEATPKVSILGDSRESEPLRPGWRSWRLTAPGWPGADWAVHLVDSGRRALQAWALALGLMLAGIVTRRVSARWRMPALVLLMAVLAVTLVLSPAHLAPLAWGAVAGVLGVLFLWLGRAMPGRVAWRSRESRLPSTVHRINPGVTTTLLVAVTLTSMVAWLAVGSAIAAREADAPIIALFPYDGPPDPARKPDRALLRREDAVYLEALAATGREPTSPAVRVVAATHRVHRRSAREVAVESDFRLVCDRAAANGTPLAWTFPVEDASEITATLDDHAVPVAVQPAGRNATVILASAGGAQSPSECRLRLRRLANLHRGASEDVLRLTINPVATAEIEVEDSLPGRPDIDVPSARGQIVPDARGTGARGLLGPADRLEVHWSEQNQPGRGDRAGVVEGLLVWDARPAGDRVHARLTYQGTGGTSAIRLKVEPGVVVRPGNVGGIVDVNWQGSDDRPEWVASFDPPLADGATVPLEFWRPAHRGSAEGRALPRIVPVGVERYSGSLAFRRPAGWSGRLGPGAELEPMTDEAFVKAWGTLPDEPLVLAGAGRFVGAPTVSIAVGPPPSQLLVDSDVQLTIDPGRISVNVEAELTTVSGRSDQVELAIPPALEIIHVEANGLSDWRRPARDRLTLRLDSAVLQRRNLRIQAWLPVLSDPLATGATNLEVDVPWPVWRGADVRSGRLTVVSPTRFQLIPSGGATALVPTAGTTAAGGAESGGAGYRATYRIDRAEALGRLSWEVEPPRLGVLVLSQLTVLPDVAEWVAVLRYDVAGGAAEAFHLKVPTVWAAAARVQVVGDGHKRITETRGPNTFWTIQPDHPTWGSQRLIVRSAIPLPKAAALAFPELSPLGRGSVDTYLALVGASGRELVKEGSPGLQPVVDDTRFAAEEFAGPTGVSRSVYHVRRDVWSLKVYDPGELRPSDSVSDEARVSLAEISSTQREDGSGLGLAVYEIVPRSGPFLAIDPPHQSEPLWAAVNSSPAPILRSTSGRWLIPIPTNEEPVGLTQMPVPVRLIWKCTPTTAGPDGAHALALPALGQPNVPTLVSTHTPFAFEVKSPNGSFEVGPRERHEIGRLEWLGRHIVASLATLDRGSQRECEALVSGLLQFEVLAREARRSAVWNPSSPLDFRDVRIARLDERIKIARDALDEALRNAALDEFAESARIHVGLLADDPSFPTLEVPEPPTNVRLRYLGRPRFFQGESTFKDRPPVLSWTAVPKEALFQRPLEWALLLVGTAACALAATFAVEVASRAPWLRALTLAVALVTLAVVAGPVALAAATAIGSIGWLGRDR
jgi:hypothetical protein